MYDHTKEVIQFALCETLAFIRALHWSHQQSMWTSEDYGHRMLFDKLRWATSAEIDELAEQCVTFFGSESINQIDQCQKMNKILGWVSDENPIKQAELLEDKFLGYLLSVYEMVATAKKMTMGLDITLQNMAKTHENNLYLLRQSSKVKKASLTQATPQSRVASRYLEKQSIQKEANFFYKIKRLFSKGIKQHEQEIKKMGFKIINRDENHTKFKNERTIGYGEVIEYTWSVETPGGYFAKIKWTDILGKGMWFEGKSYVGKDEWNRYYQEPMWNEKYKERYKKNKGFFTWEISTYMNDNFRGQIGYERFVKTKDAYRYMNRLSKAQKSDDPYDQELRLANGNLEKQGFNKYNVPELVGQLMSVLEKNGLEDTVAELKQRGFTKIINRAWQNRER